jgi:hypothetical protein
MIKYTALSVLIYTTILSGVSYFVTDLGFTLGVIIGGVTVFVSISGIALHWYLIIQKKLIALALLIIIFKYLILIGLLWSLYSFKWISPIGFCLGLTSLMFSLIVALVIKRFENKTL